MQTFITNKVEVTSQNFNDIANKFLNESALSVNNEIYRILEIEIYLHDKTHSDIYSHCDADQLQYGGFYFHKFKNGTFKSGTFKGMDVSLGNAETQKYCGILIRAIQNMKTSEIIEGPCLSVNRILQEYKASDIKEFVAQKYDNPLKLIDYKHSVEQIYVGPRIGLQSKTSKVVKSVEFVDKDYRYLIYKTKKGRKSLKLLV